MFDNIRTRSASNSTEDVGSKEPAYSPALMVKNKLLYKFIMPFGFGKKEEPSFTTESTDKDELEEIQRIAHRLEKDESVIVVAKQSRFKPGGSKLTPDTIFITNKRIIIRNPWLWVCGKKSNQ